MVRSLEREDARPAGNGNANLELQLNRIEAKLNSILESLGGKTEKKAKIEGVKEVAKEEKKETKKAEKPPKKEKAKKETKEKKAKKTKKEPEEEIIFE